MNNLYNIQFHNVIIAKRIKFIFIPSTDTIHIKYG